MSNEQLAIYLSSKLDLLDKAIEESYNALKKSNGIKKKNILGKEYIDVEELTPIRQFQDDFNTEYNLLLPKGDR